MTHWTDPGESSVASTHHTLKDDETNHHGLFMIHKQNY